MTQATAISRPRSRFLKIKCHDCGNVQPVYNKVNMTITCHICGATLATPTGGKSIIRGKVIGVYNNG